MKWREIFVPLTLRAFKRIHYNYSIWGLGQQLYENFDPKSINQNHGLLLANETSVCDSITHEFINSPLTNGACIDEEVRYYSIFREMDFTFDKDSSDRFDINGKKKRTKTVDLLLNRYKLTATVRKIYQKPVLIEVKRYHYFTPNIVTGKPDFPKTNETAIIKDIEYLRQIRDNIDKLQFELKVIKPKGVFIYTLFWGIFNDANTEEPEDIVKSKFSGYLKVADSCFEFLPIRWDKSKVTDWIWFCLAEIDRVEGNEEDCPFIDLNEVNDAITKKRQRSIQAYRRAEEHCR